MFLSVLQKKRFLAILGARGPHIYMLVPPQSEKIKVGDNGYIQNGDYGHIFYFKKNKDDAKSLNLGFA